MINKSKKKASCGFEMIASNLTPLKCLQCHRRLLDFSDCRSVVICVHCYPRIFPSPGPELDHLKSNATESCWLVGHFWREINIKRPEPDDGSQSEADYWHLGRLCRTDSTGRCNTLTTG
jgi:hypothetical protein